MVYVLPSEAAFDLRVCAAYQNSSAELRRVVELFGSHLAIPLLAQHLEGVGEHMIDVLDADHLMDLRRASADFSQSSRLFWYCAACCGSSSTSAMNLTISFFIPAIYRIFHESSQTAGAGKGQKIHTFRPEIVPSMARIIRAGMTLFSQRRTPPTRYPYTCRL